MTGARPGHDQTPKCGKAGDGKESKEISKGMRSESTMPFDLRHPVTKRSVLRRD